jgi:hypothetical protein
VKKVIKIILIVTLCLTASVYGQEKIAQTGFNFLVTSSDARSAALGGAVTSLTGFDGALFHNPASMAHFKNFVNVNMSVNKWIADINYLAASAIIAPEEGNYGVLGISLQSVDYGEVEGTIVNPYSPIGYLDTKVFTPNAYSIGLGYAKMLNDKFSVGAQIKYTYQSLGESYVPSSDSSTTLKKNTANAMAYDFGTVYHTGFKSLVFGMFVRNFSSDIKYAEESFQLPLLFSIGISADLFDFIDVGGPEQELFISIDSTHPRSHPEQVKFGAEYLFMKILALRGGYVIGNDEDDVSFGLGINYMGIAVDYAYTPFGVFDNVQRFTARIAL